MPTRYRQAALFFHTARYLRPIQVAGRLWHGLYRPASDTRPAPPLREPIARPVCYAARAPSMIGAGRFRFLNREREIATAEDWNDPASNKLWLYNLHYFDDLNSENSAARLTWHIALIVRWISENPPPRGNGWESYPLSLRIVNWIKWALMGGPLDAMAVHSLAIQVRHLRRRLEYHLLGNHLFVNAKALVFAGLFFDGPEADSWLCKGLAILRREIPEQILPDGGHFERSTMYHALALEDMLDLINVVRVFPDAMPALDQTVAAAWVGIANRMRVWLSVMSHPDGGIGFFNDAAHGVAPDNMEMERYAVALGFEALPSQSDGITHLESSGYVRVQRGSFVALLDVAPIGPDYQPGHAHADTLSFELSMRGRRMVVNGGTSLYGVGVERLLERGTAAHSTVEVASESSSEIWSAFRVARRARPFDLRIERGENAWRVTCSHDGYARLPRRPIHRREWSFGIGSVTVSDDVSDQSIQSIARFHLHPTMALAVVDVDAWVIRADGDRLAKVTVELGQGTVNDSRYAPQFGVVEAARCLIVSLCDGKAKVRFE